MKFKKSSEFTPIRKLVEIEIVQQQRTNFWLLCLINCFKINANLSYSIDLTKDF